MSSRPSLREEQPTGTTEARLLFPDMLESTQEERELLACLGTLFLEPRSAPMSAAEIIDSTREHNLTTIMLRTSRTRFDKSTLSQLGASVDLINSETTGLDHIDIDEATARGIGVTHVPVSLYAADEVAEFVWAQILAAAKRIVANDRNTRDLQWRNEPGYMHGLTLKGKIIGIVGFGNIGTRVAQLAKASCMSVVAATANPSADRAKRHGIEFVSKSELLRRSDVIVLAAPLTDQTAGMIGNRDVAEMKDTAIVVNVGRGALVDEAALANAAAEGKIFAYCTDVYTQEPIEPASPLRNAKHVLLAPHIAWCTRETVGAAFDIWRTNVERYYAGRPVNLVNRPSSGTGA